MFSNTLPAPGTLINAAGILDPSGMPAPGFSGLKINSNEEIELHEARSGRGQPTSDGKHFWSFTINYHPMTAQMYTGLESFLYGHGSRKNPFYVTLPNFAVPRQPSFETYARANTIQVLGTYFSGDSQIIINAPIYAQLLPGCFINIVNVSDALHKSTYKVARVETPTMYSGSSPANGTQRLTIFPPLQRDIIGGATAKFIDPAFRVIQKNTIDPEFDENNLVTISLEVRELLP